MNNKIIIAVDAMGGENSPKKIIDGIAHFSNGSTSEAVLSFLRFKDGKIISIETGATPLSDDYKLIGTE